LLDGDNIRHRLNKDLSFSDADRTENIRRIAEVAALMLDAGLVVLGSFISPFERDRAMIRDIVGADRYVEIFVNCPLEVCEQRDVKGLYQKARAGLIPKFTGIDSPYEAPTQPDVEVRTDLQSLDDSSQQILHSVTPKITLHNA
jgi:adenylyl-sulfate kinase